MSARYLAFLAFLALASLTSLGCSNKPNCRRLEADRLEGLLVSLEADKLIILDDDPEASVECIKEQARTLVKKGKASPSLQAAIIRASLARKWSDMGTLVRDISQSTDPAVASAALMARADVAPEEVKKELGEHLKSKSSRVRMTAAVLAARWGLREHAGAIAAMLATEEGPQLKEYRRALIALKAPNQILAYLKSAKEGQLARLVPAIQEGARSDVPLVELLAHPDAKVRRTAVRYIGHDPNVAAGSDDYWDQMSRRDETYQSRTPEAVDKVLVGLAQVAAGDADKDARAKAADKLSSYAGSLGNVRRGELFDAEQAKPKSELLPVLCRALGPRQVHDQRLKKASRGKNREVRQCAKDLLRTLAKERKAEAERERIRKKYQR